jgi:divalent metal cation (Fe/Co/Zn/Cd) transporter
MSRRLVRFAWLAVVALLLGAAAFGLWHVVVGGLVNGNPRAGGFGLGLAAGSAVLLAVVAVLRRRTRSRRRAPAS